jgi:hypothetical protein
MRSNGNLLSSCPEHYVHNTWKRSPCPGARPGTNPGKSVAMMTCGKEVVCYANGGSLEHLKVKKKIRSRTLYTYQVQSALSGYHISTGPSFYMTTQHLSDLRNLGNFFLTICSKSSFWLFCCWPPCGWPPCCCPPCCCPPCCCPPCCCPP